MPTVSVYLAASPSADRPSGDRPREPLNHESEQLRAQLERAKALKAATIAPHQQVAPSRRFMGPSTSYGSHHDKYVAPYSYSSLYSSAYAPNVPAVASAARYPYADARPFEHAFSPGATRIAERPRESRPSVAVTLALPPSASILDSAAASPPVLAASVAASQALHAALKVAAYGSSVPSTQAPPAATQSTPLPNPPEAPRREAPSINTPSTGGKGGAPQPPVDLQATRTTILIRRNVTKRLTSSAKASS